MRAGRPGQGCIKADYCVTRILWEKIRDSINNVIDSISLQDMVDDYERIARTLQRKRGKTMEKRRFMLIIPLPRRCIRRYWKK